MGNGYEGVGELSLNRLATFKNDFLYHNSFILIIVGLLALSGCGILDESPVTTPFENSPPETYLSVSSQSSIYAYVDSITCDSLGVCDTSYSYYFEADSLPNGELDTLHDALQTILASTQTMTWWGEDPDGDVIGYYYKWQHESDWTYTTNEFETFIIPIRTAMDIFGFQVKAMDSDSLVDPTPARLVLPVRNTPPEIEFRYQSNPIVTGPTPDITEKTFPTRTFLWAVSDDDGLETVDSIFYALDDTTDWTVISSAEKSVTLTELTPGTHVFYLKVRDIAGSESKVIHYPDSADSSTPNTWEVIAPVGDVLLVDDFSQDEQNRAMDWYMSILDTVPGVGPNGYSVWEIGSALPFSERDVSATFNYFDHIIWYSAASGPEQYGDAANPINSFLQGGGNMVINVTELIPTAKVWFPYDTTSAISPAGRLRSGKVLSSTIHEDLDLELSRSIPFRMQAFGLNDTTIVDPIDGPTFTPIYILPEPTGSDPWLGRPIVAAEFDHRTSANVNAGKVILFSMPFHDGTTGGAFMEGLGSSGKFISWTLTTRFAQ